MKEKQTFGVQFVGRKNREKVKSFTIFARITINGAVSEISLKQNISSTDWNPVAEMGKGRKAEINPVINHLHFPMQYNYYFIL